MTRFPANCMHATPQDLKTFKAFLMNFLEGWGVAEGIIIHIFCGDPDHNPDSGSRVFRFG